MATAARREQQILINAPPLCQPAGDAAGPPLCTLLVPYPVKSRCEWGKEPTNNVMPGFGAPFSGLANERKLSKQELVRAIRFMVAAEYEAVQMYMQLAESTDNKFAIAVLQDIADEERVHAGEFLKLLHHLAPTRRSSTRKELKKWMSS